MTHVEMWLWFAAVVAIFAALVPLVAVAVAFVRDKLDKANASTVAKLVVENLKLRDTVDGFALDIAELEVSRDYQADARMAERDRADKLAGAITRLREAVYVVSCPLCHQAVGLVPGTWRIRAHRNLWEPRRITDVPTPDCPASGRRPENVLIEGSLAGRADLSVGAEKGNTTIDSTS